MTAARRAIPLLGFGFCVAVAGRVLIGGRDVAQSLPAGLVFAGCLFALSWSAGVVVRSSWRAWTLGVAGGLFLCLPAVFGALHGSALLGAHRPGGSFLIWAAVVSVVAVAEEVFLRGALYNAITGWRGESAAIVLCAVAFAGLHVPLYGWQVVPLDLAVGLWLGALRKASGTAVTPAISHTLADLLGWWLR